MDKPLQAHWYHPDPVLRKYLEANSGPDGGKDAKWFKLVGDVDFEALVAALPPSQTLLPKTNPQARNIFVMDHLFTTSAHSSDNLPSMKSTEALVKKVNPKSTSTAVLSSPCLQASTQRFDSRHKASETAAQKQPSDVCSAAMAGGYTGNASAPSNALHQPPQAVQQFLLMAPDHSRSSMAKAW